MIPNQKGYIRCGRITSKFYPVCRIVLCQYCFDIFHTSTKLEVPKCVKDKLTVSKRGRKSPPVCPPAVSNMRLNNNPSLFARKRKIADVKNESMKTIRKQEVRKCKKAKVSYEIDNINLKKPSPEDMKYNLKKPSPENVKQKITLSNTTRKLPYSYKTSKTNISITANGGTNSEDEMKINQIEQKRGGKHFLLIFEF